MSNSDERQLLASIDASVEEQDEYESQVIRNATQQLAPQLTTAAFPPLHALAPSYSAQSPWNPSDLPVIKAVLERTRQAIVKAQHVSNAEELDKLHLKEQMLLCFLSSIANVPRSKLPVQSYEAEARRSQAIQQVADGKKLPRTGSLKPRVPMMKRKRAEAGLGQEEYEEQTAEEKEKLKKLRLERMRQREERRRAIAGFASSGSSSSDEEEEAEFVSDSTAQPMSIEATTAVPPDSALATTICPLCQSDVTAASAAELDAVLSQHMNDCQRMRPSRRRATRSVVAEREDVPLMALETKRPAASTTKRTKRSIARGVKTAPSTDDRLESNYEDRVDEWIERGLDRMKDMKERDGDEVPPGAELYPGGLWIPAWMNDRLFGYQRTGLRWMWELHLSEAGGILGDEMGLGKTVQICAYLGALVASRKLRTVLIVAPATMLQHWLKELAVWAPGLRRILIHQSGETDGLTRTMTPQLLRSLDKWLKEARTDRLYEAIDDEDRQAFAPHSFCGTGYAIITTYENVRRNVDLYTSHQWSYCILDEAQKIRNPDADVTLACKRIRTPHRLAMSGTPIQNDLKELWSLFDFAFPGRLGTLPAFEQEFSEPIRRGGYSNASPMQVQLAYRCALMLKDLIDPYLLRRRKKDVKEVSRMPGKTEHVLFCRLTRRQRLMYEAYLQSDDVSKVMRGSGQLLAAVTMLRKICNHPDLVCDPDQASFDSFLKNGTVTAPEGDESESSDEEVLAEETLMDRSGKLEVLSKILPLWHKQGHRVLVFCQWRKMLNIIQRFIMLKGWKFGRLDGNTSVAARQRLVDAFNTDESYFLMLCTTRTGGVGLNLTGANRIILYDPDFNPQTDAQARERAWRFGQRKEVAVYRLISAGTIEEKIYQRQIFKTALSNAVLQDPRQRRLFSQRDLKDLFTLKADTGSVRAGGDGFTETSEVTKGGVVGPDEELSEETSKDNEETLKKVMKSKGLAGIFDHGFVEGDNRRKSASVLEMEEQAKRVAREAVSALRESVATQDRFEPTWTGSEKTESRFGPSRVNTNSDSGARNGSSGLLASLRKRSEMVQTAGGDLSVEEGKKYTGLLARVKDYVRRRHPTTDELLEEFKTVSSSDVAIFRRLLKSVATLDKGRWYLKAK